MAGYVTLVSVKGIRSVEIGACSVDVLATF